MPLTAESAARKDRTSPQAVTLEHRHFAFIAATLRNLKPAEGIYEGADMAREQWRDTVDHFVDACDATNPRFDRRRFLAACGI